MPVTSNGLFANVVQSSTGLEAWSNPENIETEALVAGISWSGGSFTDSETISATDPASGLELPNGSVITDIKIEITAERTAGGIEFRLESIAIAGQNEKLTADIPAAPTLFTLDGDLAYWGLSQTQAQDFAAGSEPLTFIADKTFDPVSTPGGGNVAWAKVEFTFTFTPPINLPGLF
jgi:hypothetical protein